MAGLETDFISVESRQDGTHILLNTPLLIGEPLFLWSEDQLGQKRWVRGGRGQSLVTSSTTLVIDALAPRGEEIIYRIGSGASGANSPMAVHTLQGTGQDEITDLLGRERVALDRVVDGDRGEYADATGRGYASGASTPFLRTQPNRSLAGECVVVTSGRQTHALKELITTGLPVLLHHDKSRCEIPGCPVPGVQIISITRQPFSRTGVVAQAEREWSLSFVVVADPEADRLTPLSTWGDFNAYWQGFTWGDFNDDWSTRQWSEFNQVAWGEAV